MHVSTQLSSHVLDLANCAFCSNFSPDPCADALWQTCPTLCVLFAADENHMIASLHLDSVLDQYPCLKRHDLSFVCLSSSLSTHPPLFLFDRREIPKALDKALLKSESSKDQADIQAIGKTLTVRPGLREDRQLRISLLYLHLCRTKKHGCDSLSYAEKEVWSCNVYRAD